MYYVCNLFDDALQFLAEPGGKKTLPVRSWEVRELAVLVKRKCPYKHPFVPLVRSLRHISSLYTAFVLCKLDHIAASAIIHLEIKGLSYST